MLLIVIHPLFICGAIHECIMFALKGKHQSWQELMSVKGQKEMTYQSIKVNVDGRGAEFVCLGGGGANHN